MQYLLYELQKYLFCAENTGPINSWQIEEEIEVTTEFIWGSSKITADGDCSQELKRCLQPGKKGMTGLDSLVPNP